jgi:MFS family permease
MRPRPTSLAGAPPDARLTEPERRIPVRGLRGRQRGGQPRLSRDIWVLGLVAFIVALGFGIVGPAIPLLAEHFGVGKTAAATAISAFALCRFVAALVNGRLVELIDVRRVLAAGLVLQAVTTLAAGLAPTFTWVVVLRAVGGFGSAAFTVAAMALLLQLAPPEARGRAAGVFQGGFLLGGIVGPAAGGFLAEVTPRLPFIVYGVFLAVAGAVGMALLSRTPAPHVPPSALLGENAEEAAVVPMPPVAPAGPPSVPGLKRGARNRAFLACLVANLGVGWVLYGMRTSLMPIYIVEELDKTPAWAGTAFFVGSLAQVAVLAFAARLVDGWGRRPAMLLGTSVTCAAMCALILPASLGIFLTSMAALGAAAAFLGSAPAAVLGDVVGDRSGSRVALFQMASDAGAICGPLLAGALTDAFSYQAAFASGAVVLGLGAVVALVMPETGRRVPARSRTVLSHR